MVEPLRNLEREFNQFSGAFEPMRIMRDQMREISTTFAANVAEFAQILEPLNQLRQQLDEAVHALEPAGALYREFSKLSSILGKAQEESSDNAEPSAPANAPVCCDSPPAAPATRSFHAKSPALWIAA